jgi:site-specific recombinase XerD
MSIPSTPSSLHPIESTRLVEEFAASLGARSPATVDGYQRAVRQLLDWFAARPGHYDGFHPDQFTRTAVETFLATLDSRGASVSHRARVKSALSAFAEFLIEEKDWLRRNPTRGVALPAQALLAPRVLSADQRYALRSVVERDGAPRSAALFALGYWAGCRVSDVSWLRVADTHLTRKAGWLHVGYKGGKTREIDLVNEARRALDQYVAALIDRAEPQDRGQDWAQRRYAGSPRPPRGYVFASQRQERLTEAGIHHWLRALKRQATKAEWDLIHDVTFHDLRHDFAHRAREAGWSLEEVAYYLGHVTKRGTPAIQTTARYTQVSREQVAAKLRFIRG